ncbi:TMEM164 family domain-containing protein [Ditylenchus destructor]|uniref:TMEM164 family domain-containing protein n=1 Tax=Ditylenchus destructor TaxID=166010 RepID=A0AAD4MKG7_9BILA|nr:TMEM164 family domain-containing protein [Ditylenchus destructor]
MEVKLWRLFSDIAVGGIDFSMPENGGTDCINYLPAYQRFLETIKIVPTFRRALVSLSPIFRPINAHGRMFFMFYAGIFMIELFYKVVTRTLIFILQPCHICTTMQLVLLRFRDEKRLPWTQQLFRFHLYTLPGALIALLFPMIDTRLMVGEVFIFYLQHALILITPLHLMLTSDFYRPEQLRNISWPIFSISLIILYHFLMLQCVGLLTHANLNCIMCPAASDPFKGRFYRVIAVLLQSFIVIPFFTKCYSYFSAKIILLKRREKE